MTILKTIQRIFGMRTDAGIYDMPAGGKAIIMGTCPLDFASGSPPKAGEDAEIYLHVSYYGRTVLTERIHVEYAEGIDTAITFCFTDALGCDYGFGAVFAKKK